MQKTNRSVRVLALAAVLAAMTGPAQAKGKPAPITCPPDVAVALATTCPCGGVVLPDTSTAAWKNHGKYVSCVAHYRNQLRKAGCLTDDQKRAIMRCAARSTCGKEDRVLCCFYDLGTCKDLMPGDNVAAGVCSNDATVPCDVAANCVKSHSRIAHDDASCVADGGVDVGSGSVCQPCPPPAP